MVQKSLRTGLALDCWSDEAKSRLFLIDWRFHRPYGALS